MASTKAISVPVTGNTAPLRKALGNATKDLNRFGASAAAAAKKAALGLGAAGAGAAVFGVKIYKMAALAEQADKRVQRIAVSMRLFGLQTSTVTQRVLDYADALERETGVTAETIKAAQAKLLTFRQLALTADTAGGAFDRATQATIDMAAAGFGSAEQNAVQLGKALEDPIKGVNSLRRSGITFTESEKAKLKVLVDTGKILEAQTTILEAVETQVKGTAASTALATDRIRNGFGEVTDAIGSYMIPIMDRLADAVVRVGEKATLEGLGASAKQVRTELHKLGYTTEGTVSGFGRVINASVRVSNVVRSMRNGWIKFSNALGFTEGGMMKAQKTLETLEGAQRKAWLAAQGYKETLSGILLYTGKVVESQKQLNAVMGPVASRNILDFQAHHAAYLKSLEAQEKAANAAADKEKAREAARKKRFADLKRSVKETQDAIRSYIGSIRDQINSEVNLSTAFSQAQDQQTTATENLNTALTERREAYAALHQAQVTGDAKAYGEALTEVARAEQAVTAAQEVKPKDYTAIFAAQIAAAKSFAASVKQLVAAGLGKAGLAQILDLGPVAGAQVAKDLLAGTGGMTISSLNADLADIVTTGEAAGMAIPGFSDALAATVGGTAAAPTIVVQAGVGDPVAIGAAVAATLKDYGATIGGVPIVTKQPKVTPRKKTTGKKRGGG